MAKQDKNTEVAVNSEATATDELKSAPQEPVILGDAPREVTPPPYSYGQRIYTPVGKEGVVVSLSAQLVTVRFDDLTESTFSL